MALQQAITVLKKENERSLLQTDTHVSMSTRATAIKTVLQKLPTLTVLKAEELSLLQGAVKAETGYAPQSESIHDTFASDLQDTTQQEAKSNREYEIFIDTKQQELAKMEEIKAKKESMKADAEQALSEASAL